jgi:glycosyltransferase involved in cell wall biosynthesis
MNKKQVVIGNFGENGKGNCGQTIKTNVIFKLLQEESKEEVLSFNTYTLLSSPFKILNLIYTIIRYKKFVVLPAQRALPILAMLFYIFNKKAKYIVIGGWLPEFLGKTNKMVKNSVIKQFELFVETSNMRQKLKNINVSSKVLPNFKNFSKFSHQTIMKMKTGRVSEKKFVYMSRVIKAKGCLDAMKALHEIALIYTNKKFVFDIYGVVSDDFSDEFYSVLNSSLTDNLIINYMGFVSPDVVQEKLLNYDFFLFPTYYEGEGFPGCLVDAFSAGVPVIASDWRYNNEIVNHTKNGFLYKSRSVEELVNILNSLQGITECEYQKLVEACLNDSLAFHEDNVKMTMKDYSII